MSRHPLVAAMAAALAWDGETVDAVFAEAASRRGLKLAQWCREALEEKLERES